VTVLVVGISHRTAPVSLLDRIALVEDQAQALAIDLLASAHVAEAMVVATCNRVEVYAEVTKFHGGVVDVTERLAKAAGVARDEVTPHVYVRYEERAVQHLFDVTAGLDSMVVGETQILGQVRNSLRLAQESATIGRSLNDLVQTALRVGKRVHHETGIDHAGASVVSVALDMAAGELGGSLVNRRALVVGAGAMSSLAATVLARAGASVVIVNRTFDNGQRLAESLSAQAIRFEDLTDALGNADIVVTCTGAAGVILDVDTVREAIVGRDSALVVVDLALPHDTDPEIDELAGVSRIDIGALANAPGAHVSEGDVTAARTIVAEEVIAFVGAIAAQRVEPVVVSLRARADEVVDAELERLRLRLPQLDDETAAEFARSLRRAVSTLLHTPTVRMKELAAETDGTRFAQALHLLFDLDPEAISQLTASTDVTVESLATSGVATYDELLGGAS
jgi:glutamyl-tRNA reductase